MGKRVCTVGRKEKTLRMNIYREGGRVMALADYLQLGHEGAGLHARNSAANVTESPVLIIGLGGTGARAVASIKKIVKERFGVD